MDALTFLHLVGLIKLLVKLSAEFLFKDPFCTFIFKKRKKTISFCKGVSRAHSSFDSYVVELMRYIEVAYEAH